MLYKVVLKMKQREQNKSLIWGVNNDVKRVNSKRQELNFCLLRQSIAHLSEITWRWIDVLQTFMGVLHKKIRTRAVFKETPTNYISIERLWTVEFDKIIFCFADCFP